RPGEYPYRRAGYRQRPAPEARACRLHGGRKRLTFFQGVLAPTMSPKRLLPLVVILIVLGVLAVLFKRPSAPPQLAQEVGLERLVPPTLHPDSITGFELYRGAQPQEIVRLHKRDGAWVVASRFD